jgi:hypothetical protein
LVIGHIWQDISTKFEKQGATAHAKHILEFKTGGCFQTIQEGSSNGLQARNNEQLYNLFKSLFGRRYKRLV